MKTKLFFLASIFTIPSSAQTTASQDSVLLSAHYTARFKTYAEANFLYEEEKVLDIGRESACFYGWAQYQREQIQSDVMASGGGFADVMTLTEKLPHPRQFYSIYHDYPSAGHRTITDRVIKPFYYDEDTDSIDWTLCDRDTTILGLSCRQAVCSYRNHRWTVCYTEEIPVSLGPWKLQGLPGLILYAADDTGVFSFDCISIESGHGVVHNPTLSDYERCTREQLRYLQREMWRNPQAFASRFGGDSSPGLDANGQPIHYPERTALFLDEE